MFPWKIEFVPKVAELGLLRFKKLAFQQIHFRNNFMVARTIAAHRWGACEKLCWRVRMPVRLAAVSRAELH